MGTGVGCICKPSWPSNRTAGRCWDVPINVPSFASLLPRGKPACNGVSAKRKPMSGTNAPSRLVPLLHQACECMWQIVGPISLSSCTCAGASIPTLSCAQRKIGVCKPRGELWGRSLSRSARSPGRISVRLIFLLGMGTKPVPPHCICHGRLLNCCHLAMILVSTNFLPCPSGSCGCGKKGLPKAKSRSNGSC